MKLILKEQKIMSIAHDTIADVDGALYLSTNPTNIHWDFFSFTSPTIPCEHLLLGEIEG